MEEIRTIITHNGGFHCDEALGFALLKRLPEYSNAKLIRTRDPELIKSGDIVIDVGAVFDLERKLFDHHQRSFTEVFGVEGFTRTKLSSAGLVYKYYGKDLFRSHYNVQDETLVDILYKKVYENFIESVDAIDNGISIAPEGQSRYKNRSDLSTRVERLNINWNETGIDENERFLQASELCFEEFDAHVSGIINHWWPARQITEEAFKNRFNVHPSGRIVELKTFCPWKEHLTMFELDAKLSADETLLYCIFADPSGSFRVGTFPHPDNEFQPRKPLSEPLRGLRDADLSAAAGIEGLIFVHATGFIGGARTRDGALKLAELSLNYNA